MKILTYNINHSSQAKVDKLLGYDADVLILPELACPSKIILPDLYRIEWIGDIDTKGLGVIWKSDLKAEVPGWFNPNHQYFLPIIIEGNLILAAWPTTTGKNKPKAYPKIAMEALLEYAPYLKEYPSIISGDMNCYVGQSGETHQFSISSIIDFLGKIGFVSLYHNKTGELLGKETTATFYYLFKENSPFFLDYTFSNIPCASYQLGKWDKAFSDHVPQYIRIAD